MKINREICRIAIPAIISNITVPLLGLCDTTIAGHLGSGIFIAAIAVGTMMINSVLWCTGFLRSGTSGLTAQAYGAKSTEQQSELFTRSLCLGLGLGVLVILLQWPLILLLSKLIAAEPVVTRLARQYFSIVAWGAPAILGTMAVSGWFLGMQSSFYPMVIAILTNIINIGASLLCVFTFGMGFAGTAAGTTIANWCGLFIALLLVRKFNGGKLPVKDWRDGLRLRGSGRFFRVSADIFLRSLCIIAVSMGMTSFGAQIGSQTLATNAVMLQFFTFFSYFMDGFAFAAEALTGKSAGMHDHRLFTRTGKALCLWAIGMAVTFTLIYLCFWPQICAFITPETEVLAGVERYHIWLLLIPVLTVAAFIYDGIYIGLTATRLMFVATAAGAVVFYLFNTIVTKSLSGMAGIDSLADPNNILWASFLAYLLIRGASLAALCPRATRHFLR